jgi:hypothetical protein
MHTCVHMRVRTRVHVRPSRTPVHGHGDGGAYPRALQMGEAYAGPDGDVEVAVPNLHTPTRLPQQGPLLTQPGAWNGRFGLCNARLGVLQSMTRMTAVQVLQRTEREGSIADA